MIGATNRLMEIELGNVPIEETLHLKVSIRALSSFMLTLQHKQCIRGGLGTGKGNRVMFKMMERKGLV